MEISHLIEYAKTEIEKLEQRNTGGAKVQPEFPMAIFYIGGSSLNYHKAVKKKLFDVWPQYEGIIPFYKIESEENNLACYRLDDVREESSKKIDIEKLRNELDGMFLVNKSFREYSHIYIYYIIDSASIEDLKVFKQNFSEFGSKLSDNSVMRNEKMTILLLNETQEMIEKSSGIRGDLYSWIEDEEHKLTDSILLLSNRLSTNALIDPDDRPEIIADFILMSNCNGTRLNRSIFDGKVMTAKYSRGEKNNRDIGQIVVESTLKKMIKNSQDGDQDRLNVEDLYKKLDLAPLGLFNDLDKYITPNKFQISNELLNMFPMKDIPDRDNEDYMSKTIKMFDNLTMGSFLEFLNSKVECIKNELLSDQTKVDMKKRFQSFLSEQYTNHELIFMQQNLQDLKEVYYNKLVQPDIDQILVKDYLKVCKYKLGKEEEISELFFSFIDSLAVAATECIQVMDDIQKNMRRLPNISDRNLKDYYMDLVEGFLNLNKDELEKIRKVKKEDDLEQLIKNVLKNVVWSDSIFASSYLGELETRLNIGENLVDAKQYIYQILSKNGRQYLRIQQNPTKLLSAVLIKKETQKETPKEISLYEYLKGTKEFASQNCFYFDTGCERIVEHLELFEVEKTNMTLPFDLNGK